MGWESYGKKCVEGSVLGKESLVGDGEGCYGGSGGVHAGEVCHLRNFSLYQAMKREKIYESHMHIFLGKN